MINATYFYVVEKSQKNCDLHNIKICVVEHARIISGFKTVGHITRWKLCRESASVANFTPPKAIRDEYYPFFAKNHESATK